MAEKTKKDPTEKEPEETVDEEQKKKDLDDMNDEELLELYRTGNQRARDILSVRYFKMRKSLLARFVLDDPCFLDEWELNEAYFVAYLKTEDYYQHHKGAKFLTLMCRNLANELAGIYTRAKKRGELIYVCSLDEPYVYDPDGEEERYYGDVISGSNFDESREHLNLLSALKKLLDEMEAMGKRSADFIVALYEGYSFNDACIKAKISRSYGRSILYRIKKIFDADDPGIEGYLLSAEKPLTPAQIKILRLAKRKKHQEKMNLERSIKESLDKKIAESQEKKEESVKEKKPRRKRREKRGNRRRKNK